MEHLHPLILFVERSLASGRRLRMELRRRGARVQVATSLPEAKGLAKNEAPELVVLERAMDHYDDWLCFLGDSWPQTHVIPLESPERVLEEIASTLPGRLVDARSEKSRSGTILCVDDDPQYLRSLSRTLARRGYRALVYEDSTRALEALNESSPDLVLLDIMMPGIDGLDLAERIRNQSGGRVPVVFLTALDSDEACYVGHERGARFFLTKTCEPEKMLDVVDYFAGDLDDEERDLLKSRL